MTLFDLTDKLHAESGFTGKKLEAVTFAAALGMAHYAGSEHQTYFKQRFGETLGQLSLDDTMDVVGFIADRAGIKPAPVDVNAI